MSTEHSKNHHVNQNLIVRDGELFNRRSGIGVFRAEVDARICRVSSRGHEERRIWLRRETQALVKKIEEGETVLVRGRVGEGKSALLYGARAQRRTDVRPYYYIDGHFEETQSHHIATKLHKAQLREWPVFWDSLDYLIGKSRKLRKLPIPVQRERSAIVLQHIHTFLDNGGQLIGTAHQDSWIEKNGDVEIYNSEPWQHLMERMRVQRVDGSLRDSLERRHFYTSSYPNDPARANFLANLVDSVPFYEFLSEQFSSDATAIIDLLGTYRYSKILVRDNRNANEELQNNIGLFLQGDLDEESVWRSIADFVVFKRTYLANLDGLTKS